MRKYARSLLTSITDLTDRLVSRITVTAYNALDALRRWFAAIWEHHQRFMEERPDYGPQLAALVGIVMSLLRLPTWLSRLLGGFLDLLLANAGRQSVYPGVSWASTPTFDEPQW